jgi:hypothetical protein
MASQNDIMNALVDAGMDPSVAIESSAEILEDVKTIPPGQQRNYSRYTGKLLIVVKKQKG